MMADRFKRTGDAIAAGLRCLRTAGDDGYQPTGEMAGGLASILRARLGPCERLYLASAGVLSLSRDARLKLITAAQRDTGGNPPVIPFINVMREAEDWALIASTDERRCYMGAIWRALPEGERRGFLEAIGVAAMAVLAMTGSRTPLAGCADREPTITGRMRWSIPRAPIAAHSGKMPTRMLKSGPRRTPWPGSSIR